MVLIHIITKNKGQALEIIDFLLEQKLLFNALLSRKRCYEKNFDTGELTSSIHNLIIGKTKSLLFNTINGLPISKYGDTDQMPSLYCLPIVYIDPKKGEELIQKTCKV